MTWATASKLSDLNTDFRSSTMTLGHFAEECGVELPKSESGLHKPHEDSAFSTAIKQAKRKIVLKLHPDKIPEGQKTEAQQKFVKINGVFERFSDGKIHPSYQTIQKWVQKNKPQAESSNSTNPSFGSFSGKATVGNLLSHLDKINQQEEAAKAQKAQKEREEVFLTAKARDINKKLGEFQSKTPGATRSELEKVHAFIGHVGEYGFSTYEANILSAIGSRPNASVTELRDICDQTNKASAINKKLGEFQSKTPGATRSELEKVHAFIGHVGQYSFSTYEANILSAIRRRPNASVAELKTMCNQAKEAADINKKLGEFQSKTPGATRSELEKVHAFIGHVGQYSFSTYEANILSAIRSRPNASVAELKTMCSELNRKTEIENKVNDFCTKNQNVTIKERGIISEFFRKVSPYSWSKYDSKLLSVIRSFPDESSEQIQRRMLDF